MNLVDLLLEYCQHNATWLPGFGCYLYVKEPKTWSEANDACVGMGGKLVAFERRAEMEALCGEFCSIPSNYSVRHSAVLGRVEADYSTRLQALLDKIPVVLNRWSAKRSWEHRE